MKLRTILPLVAFGLLAGMGQSEARAPDVASASAGLDTVEMRLEQLKRREHSLGRLMEQDRGELDRVHRQVIVRGRAYYRLARGAPRGDLFEHAVRVERLRQALLNDVKRERALLRKRKSNGRRMSMLRERRVPLETEHLAAGQARDALLAKQERERAFSLAFSNSVGSRDHTAVYSAAAELDVQAQTFGAMLGRLPFPLPGRTELQEVRRSYADGPGLVLHGNAGASARAVYPGRVAFADDYPNYGRTVILDHGAGYFTVTAELASIDVHAGDDLPAGSRLGQATVRNGGSEVYFEVRKGTETLPPGEWFGI